MSAWRQASCACLCFVHFPAQAEEQSILSAWQKRLSGVKKEADIAANGFDIIKNQVFSMTVKAFGDVTMIPAIDRTYHRLLSGLKRGQKGRYSSDNLL